MKKFFTYKNIKWLCAAALVLLLIPMLWLGFYAAPAADDFSYGASAHRAFVETGSVFAAVSAAAEKTVESFFGWQGTFSAIFLMAIQPAVFSEGLYWLTTVIMLAALVLGTWLFCRAFFDSLLGLDRHLADIIAVLLLLPSTQLVPSAVQAFYWFNGSVYYVFFHGLMLAAVALGVELVKKGGRWRMLLLCLLCVLLGGGNYVTALTCCIICFFGLLLLWAVKADCKKLLIPGAVLVLAFALSFLAPGNAVRQASQHHSCGAVEAVLLSFKSALDYGAQWLSLPALGTMTFVCVLAFPALKACSFAFRYPGLVTAFSYCLLSAMFCPPIYAMGNVGEERLLNIIYFMWLLLLAVNLVYWLGWFCARKKTVTGAKLKLLPLAVACIILLTAFALPLLSGQVYTSVLALGTVRSGEAKEWHDAAVRRFAILNDPEVADARIEPYPGQPYLLFYSDIVNDTEGWENVDMASFYGKNSVKFNTLD